VAELRANGVRLHVQLLAAPGLAARAPTVVFLHGLVMDNLSSWFFTVAAAASRRARVVLYDLRGHGKSERPSRGYALADMVADLAALLDEAGPPGPVTLVGNSFGALLALAFARAQPARVNALLLVDGHLGDEAFGPEMGATLRLEGEARDRRIAEAFAPWLGRHSERKRTRLADTARALVYGTSLVEDLQGTPPLAPAELATIAVPVLALYGERSDLRARAEAQLAALPRLRLEVLPGCSHSVLWEATEAVRRRTLAFLDEVAGEAVR
jgi:pimeloyl-ACP methyl ester carboxylesterase